MRWGVELWDQFDNVSSYVHKGIEFCEKYEDFCKKRCTIENNYAKHLRKLIEAFEPKKKDAEENNTTHMKCFVRMLNELKDIAGQHELVAENIEDRITIKLTQLVKSLKDERRKCVEDKEKCHAEHVYSVEQLEKSKLKYERAFKDLEKAKELFHKIDNDDHSSKSDIKKQKNVCDQKQATLNLCEGEYGKQLCEANRVKSLYYREQLPNVLDTMQNLEMKRIESFKNNIYDYVNIEVEIMPRISKCHKEIENSAQQITPIDDTYLAVAMYKTGYSIPGDYIFEDLNEKSSSVNLNNNTEYSNGGGSVNSSNLNVGTIATLGSQSLTSHTTRQKKYRTINRIKGLFLISGGKNENDLYSLPPQQLKKELLKKIENLQAEIIKQQKEREGILKLKEIYTKNEKLGDAPATAHALELNEEKLNNLNNQLKNYQDIYNEVEQNGSYNNNKLKNSCVAGTSSSSSSNSSDYSVNGGTKNSNFCTLPRVDKISTPNGQGNSNNNNNNNHIYQSPSQHSVNSATNSSVPGTPQSHHYQSGAANNKREQTPVKSIYGSNLSTGAYAVSPVSQMSTKNGNANGNKMAPIVNSNNNESFDDDDDDDDDEDDDDGCYENPSAALKAAYLKNQQTANLSQNGTSKTNISISSTNTSSIVTTITSPNKNAIIYADSQYDHVDNTGYEQDSDNIIGTALVIYAFTGSVQNAMSIQENESLSVLERDSGDGWTLVKRLSGEKGYVPTDYIRIAYY